MVNGTQIFNGQIAITQPFDFADIRYVDELWVYEGCRIVVFVGWYIMRLTIKAQNDFRTVVCLQVAMHHKVLPFF